MRTRPVRMRGAELPLCGRSPTLPGGTSRIVKPELLDQLPADDPRAIHSRRDLRRLNALMGNAGIFSAALRKTFAKRRALRMAELGAGDGVFMLRVARRLRHCPAAVQLALVDRHDLLEEKTVAMFTKLNWQTRVFRQEIFEWLETPSGTFDVIAVNLVLHHFEDRELRELFRALAVKTRLLIALEPRRGVVPLFFSRLLWSIGAGPVTRHDGPVSVRAGFAGKELSALWPSSRDWSLQERRAGMFSHLFLAQR